MSEHVRLRLSLPARAENLALTRAVVATLAESLGADREALNRVELGVTEATSNAVAHAYRGERGSVEVEVAARNGRLRVRVADLGRWRSRRRGGEGGRGLAIMRTVSDRLRIRRTPRGSQVEMEFALGPSSTSEPSQDRTA